MAETKTEKFERLGKKRMEKLLAAFRSVGNLGSVQYDYTQAHIDKILDAVDEARTELEIRLAEPSTQPMPVFTFGEPEPELEPEDDESDIDEEDGYETTIHKD